MKEPNLSYTPRGKSFPFWLPLISLPLALLVASISAGVVAALQNQNTAHLKINAPLLAVDEIGLWVVFLVALFIGVKRYGTGSFVRDYGLSLRLWPDLPVGLVVGALCQLVVLPALYYPFEAGNPSFAKALSQPAKTLVGSGRSGGEALVFLVIVIGAPIMEELFFRGLTLRSLESLFLRVGSRARGVLVVLITGAFFAVAHFEPLQFLGLWVVGMVLSLMAYRTRRLGMSISAHMSFNLVAFVALTNFR
jgi:membrane protease YdiL (CAAX protease family)